jgi:hypothetical protein
MPRSQRNDNFIDKTFTIVADLLLRIIPTTQREKEAFSYYRDGAICYLVDYYSKTWSGNVHEIQHAVKVI